MTIDSSVFSTKSEEAKRRVGSGIGIWGRFGKYLKSYRQSLTVGMVAIVGGALTGLVSPYLHAIAINDIITPAAETGSRTVLTSFRWWVPLFVLVTVANYVFQYLQTYHMRVMGERSVEQLRNDSIAKLQAISLKYFAEGEIGRIMSRPTTDSQQVRIFLRMGLTAFISDISSILGSLVIIFFLNYKLALLATAILPLAVLLMWSLGGVSRRQYRVSLANLAGLIAKLQENCSGMRVTKAFMQDEAAARGFEEANDKTVRAWKRTILISTIYLPIMQIMRLVGTGLILWYGSVLYMQGGISLGVLAAFLEYQFSYFIPLTTLLTAFDQYQSGTAALERIFDLLDTYPEVRDPEPDRAISIDTIDSVRFDDVTFGYAPNEPVLKNISLSLEGAGKLALVGPTGAGKSTTINLLERFYNPVSGSILINGHDVKDIPIANCRAHMSTVLQDTFLFPMTVRDNIRFGRPEASDEQVIEAAKAVGVHDFVMRLPGGYDYFVQENASNISIGQRQLISFARTLLVDPKLLILDEATSSIDPYTEFVLQEALKTLLANRMAIIVAHRLSTIRLCDEILVLEDGKIVEQGSHRELMARDGLYSAFYRMQFREERGIDMGAAH